MTRKIEKSKLKNQKNSSRNPPDNVHRSSARGNSRGMFGVVARGGLLRWMRAVVRFRMVVERARSDVDWGRNEVKCGGMAQSRGRRGRRGAEKAARAEGCGERGEEEEVDEEDEEGDERLELEVG